ncbi:hypothetical protein M758_1G258000 [Ceratodon purpureus]|nr:hypothetical protein M758_1G258000 [Ceratodon purpureus]
MFVGSHHQNGSQRETKRDGSKEKKQGIRAPTLLHSALPIEMHVLVALQCTGITANYTGLHCSKNPLQKQDKYKLFLVETSTKQTRIELFHSLPVPKPDHHFAAASTTNTINGESCRPLKTCTQTGFQIYSSTRNTLLNKKELIEVKCEKTFNRTPIRKLELARARTTPPHPDPKLALRKKLNQISTQIHRGATFRPKGF